MTGSLLQIPFQTGYILSESLAGIPEETLFQQVGHTLPMRTDEALLEWVRQYPKPVLLFRAYRWLTPTVSFGVNQSESACQDFLDHLRLAQLQSASEAMADETPILWVRRPTGGRAIVHGTDLSFAWVSNHPALIHRPLKDSYCILNGVIQKALAQLPPESGGIQTQFQACAALPIESSDKAHRAYIQKVGCFETTTPNDLMTQEGQKVVGSAQLRRRGGLLQHGSIFRPGLRDHGPAFQEAIQAVLEEIYPTISLEIMPAIDQAQVLDHIFKATHALAL